MNPKIFLTGDIHGEHENFGDQKFSDLNEVESAQKYVDILEKYGLKATLFFTGKSVKQDADKIREIAEKNNFEIGAHTYNSLRPQLMHRAFRKFLGSYYGPSIYQKFDVKRTKKAIENKLGIVPITWRTHAYQSDSKTPRILEEEGFQVISDKKHDGNIGELDKSGVLSIPMNVMPDHEHLLHAEKTREVCRNNGFEDVFTHKAYPIDEYISIIKEQIQHRIESGSHAVLLIHPMCMEAADSMEMFEELCDFISNQGYETELLKNIE